MGREIRRVPADWDHPCDETNGSFLAIFDQDYDDASREWWRKAKIWNDRPRRLNNDDRRYRKEQGCRWFWDWNGGPPTRESYRDRAWTEAQATHYQGYETVSEGTPVSPVFATLEELSAWMQEPIDWDSPYNSGEDWQCLQGRSAEQAEAFCKSGHAFSGVVMGGRMIDGVAAIVEEQKS